MPGEDTSKGADAPAPPAVVDLDAGQRYGHDSHTLLRPFRHKGQVYTEIKIRVPTGRDVARYVDPQRGISDGLGLMCDLAEVSADVFEVMYAGDRNAVDVMVGKHLRGARPT